MPLHEYHCQSCGTDFEQLVRRGEDVACPSCGGSVLERRLSVAVVSGAEASRSHSSARDVRAGGGCCGGSCGCR